MEQVDIKTEEEWNTTKQLVSKLLKEDERCRNDDKWLIYRVIQEICRRKNKPLFIPFEIFQDLPSYETISRVRRIIQNKERKFKPTNKKVIEKRGQREQSFRILTKQ